MAHKMRYVSVRFCWSAHGDDKFYNVEMPVNWSVLVGMCVYRLFYNGVFSIQIVVAFIVDDDSYGAFTMHVHLNMSLAICAAGKQTKNGY